MIGGHNGQSNHYRSRHTHIAVKLHQTSRNVWRPRQTRTNPAWAANRGVQSIVSLCGKAHTKGLPDPRVDRTKDHELFDVLTIAICTLLCAGESLNDMEDFGKAKEEWFRTFLNLKYGIPGHDTLNRVFAALCPVAFGECFMDWTQSLRSEVAQEIVALDGKTLRRALDADRRSKVIVSAWAQSN